MIQQQATVLWNRQAAPNCYRLGLGCPGGYEAAVPGQFVMLQVETSLRPLLRRPFSISGLIGSADRPEGIELLYKIVGHGTRRMARFTTGETVDLLGPLGKGFRVDVVSGQRFYLAAGGIGVAPIRFLAAHLKAAGADLRACRLFLGGRSSEDLLCREEFLSMGIPVTVTTDDGSSGEQCLITDPLEVAIQADPPDMVFACGPHGMLKCLAGIVLRHRATCQISTETMMACGMGACLGCAVPAADREAGYRHACIDGPVFDAGEIEW
jgi:dihydroorotate dehydrogenase electron transfer subunit